MFVVFVGDVGEALWFLQEADLDFEEHTVPGHDDHVLWGVLMNLMGMKP